MNKDHIILTNNPIIKQEFEEDSCFEMVCEKELPDLLTKCMKLLEEGCELMVDPLAGYLSRPNPYHTIVLKSASTAGTDEEEHREAYLRDMSKIDILLSRYWLNRDAYAAHGQCERYLHDHAHVDASLGRNSIRRIRDINS